MQTTLQEYKTILTYHRNHKQKGEYVGIISNILGFLSSSIGEITIKCFVGYAVFNGTQSIGMVALVTGYSSKIGDILSTILRTRTTYRSTRFQIDTLNLFVQMFVPIGSYQDSRGRLSISEMQFQNVSFEYPKMQEYEREYLAIVETYF